VVSFAPMGLEATTQAPDAELDADAQGLPDESDEDVAEEQAEGTDDEDREDTPAAEPSDRLALAEFTRSQQAFAELKRELGLDKKATRDEVLAAVRAIREAPATGDESDDEEPPEDPRIAEAERRAFDAEMRVQAAIYGDAAAQDAISVIDTLRTTNDPSELMTALHGWALQHVGQAAGAAEPAAAATDEGTTDQPLDIGTSEGDRGPSANAATTPRGRESGVVGAVRGLFQAARDQAGN
jgi:hypothetical protein